MRFASQISYRVSRAAGVNDRLSSSRTIASVFKRRAVLSMRSTLLAAYDTWA